MRAAVLAVLVLVAAIHAVLWAQWRDQRPAPDFRGELQSLSYAPFDGVGATSKADRIRADLQILSTLTRAIRLYSSTGGVEQVPPIAAEFGLKVMVGAWIDGHADRNEREIKAAIDLATHNSNVVAIVVGNETLFRGEQKVEDLLALIKRVKQAVSGRVPVTTGEIWNIWRDNPQLGYSVDFVAAHVLPYWNNITDKDAVNYTVSIYKELQNQFRGKQVMIAEFGWPSAGYNWIGGGPDPLSQAVALREFAARAATMGMDYNIVEAIDQPWKSFEGGIGPYWGILNAAREPKFAWTGPIANPWYWQLATIAVLLGVALSLPLLRLTPPRIMAALPLAILAHGAGTLAAATVAYWSEHYFRFGTTLGLSIRLLPLTLLGLIALSRPETITGLARRLAGRFRRIEPAPSKAEPAASTETSQPGE